ncbi:MAG TPA: DUF6789 family protein [Pirellulales bacterium]|nr:DUF6789 family protein [Pirellulales bacterium]
MASTINQPETGASGPEKAATCVAERGTPCHPHHFLSRSILGGAAGTAAITLMMYFVAPVMTGRAMDIARLLGSMLGGSWLAGMAMHVMLGTIVFPLVYAFVIYDVLPGGPVLKGIAWGATLWLLAQVVVMPMMGAGLFSANAGGPMAAMGSLMGHAIYGALLGSITGSVK